MKNNKLIKLIEDSGLKDKVIAERNNISDVWFSKIKNGKASPKDTILKIETFLQNHNRRAA